MGRSQRNKGRRGESTAKQLLTDRDYEILADTSSGLSTDDLVVMAPDGKIWSVECKNTKLMDIPKFRSQAIRNAKKRAWMLLLKIDQTTSWLVLRKAEKPVVWHEKL